MRAPIVTNYWSTRNYFGHHGGGALGNSSAAITAETVMPVHDETARGCHDCEHAGSNLC